MGMKWYFFFCKVRPWISIVVSLFVVLGIFLALIGSAEMILQSPGIFVLVFVPVLVAIIASIALNAKLLQKEKENAQELLRFIKGYLIYEVVSCVCGSAVEPINSGRSTVEIVMCMIVALLFEYFIWYRCNMSYFRKRLQRNSEYIKGENEDIEFDYLTSVELERTEKAPVHTTQTKKKYCSNCGCEIDGYSRQCTGCGKQYFKPLSASAIISIVLGVFLCISVALNIYLYIKAQEEPTYIVDNKYEKYYDYWKVNQDKVDFMNEFIVIVSDDNTKLYHKYGCSKLDLDSFWAYNIAAAIGEGYKACPYCN